MNKLDVMRAVERHYREVHQLEPGIHIQDGKGI
jgi:hypothetical protein